MTLPQGRRKSDDRKYGSFVCFFSQPEFILNTKTPADLKRSKRHGYRDDD